MHSIVIEVRTGARETVHDLTGECAAYLADVAADEGLGRARPGSGAAGAVPAVRQVRPPHPGG